MTNTQRNTTVLSVLLAIIITSGYVTLRRVKQQVGDVRGKNEQFQKENTKFDKMIQMQPQLEKDFMEQRLMLENQSKVIVQGDTPATTYNYLLNVLKWMDTNLNFDFSLSSGTEIGTQWNEYIISCKARFRDAFNFIKQIEYQRAVITVEDVAIASDPSGVSDSVTFSLVIRTQYSLTGSDMNNIKQKDVPPPVSSYPAFRPRVYEANPDTNIDPNLLRLDTASLVGISDTRAFIRDAQGVIHILSVGNPVAYGHLYYIDREQERAVFKTDQFGTVEDKSLFLDKQKP